MPRTRIKLVVDIDLDPMPGTMHTADSARDVVVGLLEHSAGHYNPSVAIESYDITKPHPEPPAEGLLEGVLDELQDAKDVLQRRIDKVEPIGDELDLVLSLIDQIAEERASYSTKIWGERIKEIRIEDKEGNIDKKMIDTTNYASAVPRGITFTPGKF